MEQLDEFRNCKKKGLILISYELGILKEQPTFNVPSEWPEKMWFFR